MRAPAGRLRGAGAHTWVTPCSRASSLHWPSVRMYCTGSGRSSPFWWLNVAICAAVARGPIRWHVQRMGAGPALLLLHGTGAATHSWRALAPLLAEHFTVVAPDLPGHGFTGPPGSGGASSASRPGCPASRRGCPECCPRPASCWRAAAPPRCPRRSRPRRRSPGRRAPSRRSRSRS